jgi:hypothetical protein
MADGIRKCVSEVMIYDADDSLSSDEAAEFVSDHQYGAWTVDKCGVKGAQQLSRALAGYVGIQQLSFCTHGFPGGVYFPKGNLTAKNLSSVAVSPNLFQGEGRLLFMGCETARTKAGEDFLLAAARHFFAGKGGIVGGSTIYNLGPSSGTRLPMVGDSSDGWHAGKLILTRVDGAGNVVGSKTVRPFGL